ncbi:transposase [Desulfovibrio desulfuricans]|nr:transposase [Desulfovibrio desulfuricans]MCQ5217607.1 transposase [Desulfovibrio desulfuricans]
MCLLLTRRDRLTDAQKERLRTYFADSPGIKSLYEFLHETADLLRVRAQIVDSCRRYVAELLDKIDQLRETPFAPLRTLGKTLHNWREKVPRMFRFTRNNGITEGFHRKMKLIQRRAYGFRNFENYRLRVRVLCC